MAANIVWSLLAATMAVGIEVYYRNNAGVAYHHLWPGPVLGIFINYVMWRLLQTESLVSATILFSWSTLTLRVLSTAAITNDVVSPGTWLAVGLMSLAMVSRMAW